MMLPVVASTPEYQLASVEEFENRYKLNNDSHNFDQGFVRNGELWPDNNGEHINAHGGGSF